MKNAASVLLVETKTFSYIFSNEEQEVVHVYIKLNNNLYFDANGFHSKKEIKDEYIRQQTIAECIKYFNKIK